MQVGDIVLYNHGVHETVMVSDQPLAAIVTYVHASAKEGPVKINLAVFGKNGDQWQKHSVPLWDGEGDAPEARHAFAYSTDEDLAAHYEKRDRAASDAALALNDGEPADPDSDVLHPSTRGPNKIASGPTYSATPVAPSTDGPRNWRPFDEDPYASASGGLVNPPIGPEYKPGAPHPAPNAPEPINKVPADSPANPDRPLD